MKQVFYMKWIEFMLLMNTKASTVMQINIDSHVQRRRELFGT